MLQDLKQALRSLRSRPTFTTVAILSLAVGIGTNSAIFSFANSILFSDLPYPGANRLMLLRETVDGRQSNGSPLRLQDWAAQSEVIEAAAGYYNESMIYARKEGTERVSAWRTFGDMAGTLALTPVLGRRLTAAELQGSPEAALVSHSFWRNRLGGNAEVVGRPLVLNQRSFTVAGVLPEAFDTQDIEIVAPETNQRVSREARFIGQIVRLREGTSVEQAEQRLAVTATQLIRQYPDTDRGLAVRVVPYREEVSSQARTPLMVLLAAVGFVLFSACLNIASLLVYRSTNRRPELAMRLALGASRWDIMRLLLSEGLVLAIAGGTGGFLIAMWGIDLLKHVVPPETPRLAEVQLNWQVAFFAAGLSLVTALLCSIAPALQNASPHLQEAFRGGARVAGRRHWMQRSLVVAQIGISLALLIGAGLLMRSFVNMQQRELGFRKDHLMSFSVPQSWNLDDERVNAMIGNVLREVRTLPGVDAAEFTDRLPLEGTSMNGDVAIAGRAPAELPRAAQIFTRPVSSGYHAMMGVPLKRGRYLNDSDMDPKSRRTVINETAARMYFSGVDPVGQKIGMQSRRGQARMFEIMGVVGDVAPRARDLEPLPMMYIAYTTTAWPIGEFVVRTSGEPGQLFQPIRAAVARVDPNQVVEDLRTIDQALDSVYAEPRVSASIISVFAGAALLLAAMGIYGLLSNSIAERSLELGIRIAIGARPSNILSLIYSEAMPLIAAGALAGLGAAWVLKDLLAKLLFALSPGDPLSIGLAALVLVATAIVACYLPARRASRLDPVKVLRS